MCHLVGRGGHLQLRVRTQLLSYCTNKSLKISRSGFWSHFWFDLVKTVLYSSIDEVNNDIELTYQEDTCIFCFKQNEERLITVTSKGCSTLKTYCRKRKCSSLLKLIEECENNTSKKVKVSSSLVFVIFNDLFRY